MRLLAELWDQTGLDLKAQETIRDGLRGFEVEMENTENKCKVFSQSHFKRYSISYL